MYASLKLPVGNAINDNISTGALCSAVDLVKGTASPGHTVEMANEAYDEHPDTGATITGRNVPDWPKPLHLACEGHRAVLSRQKENAERPNLFLGWDIGLAENGPIIIETNMFFADLYQCAGNGPVGTTRFAELLCHHLDRLETEYGPI